MRNRKRRRVLSAQKSKQYADLKHFQRRLKEHFDIVLSDAEIRSIRNKIQESGGIYFVERQSLGRTIHVLYIEGKEVYVVYDGNHNMPVTALTKEMYESEEFTY